MSEPNEADGKKVTDTLQAQKQLVLSINKGIGALFMLGGPVIGFNIGGISTALGLADDYTKIAIGSLFFVVGAFDFFVVPKILFKKR